MATAIILSVMALMLDATPVARILRKTVVAPLVGLQQGSERWRNAWLEREEIALARDSSALRAMNAQALVAENDQLRKLIGLGRRLQFGYIPAEALQTSVEQGFDFVTTLTLTAGSNAGVRKFSAVVAPEGLVGFVETPEPTMSIAVLYSHPDFRASAMSGDRSAYGTVYPHSRGASLRDRQYFLELRGVPFRSVLKPGAPIYTAGLGGVYPPGIAVGTVLRELEATEGLSRTYLLVPAVSPSNLTSVLILTPQRSSQGVGNIWTSAVSIDSATRSIVAAGDSLMLAAAELADRQRRATLDSVKRIAIDSVTRALGILRPDSLAADSLRPPAGAVNPPVRRPIIRDTTRPRIDTTARTRPDTMAGRIRPDTTQADPSLPRMTSI
ncbi:MAG TPA: rod shape-determining protein MreC [Gemmatimonadaceae bacterium]|nr:rod shape-determining protein MreC [Gemmatimonadaceae bacterium]